MATLEELFPEKKEEGVSLEKLFPEKKEKGLALEELFEKKVTKENVLEGSVIDRDWETPSSFFSGNNSSSVAI